MDKSPAFGEANLSNCERELIHLAGSIQPHGALLAVDLPAGRLSQASANCAQLLGATPEQLLGQDLAVLGQCLADAVLRLAPGLAGNDAQPLVVSLGDGPGALASLRRTPFEVLVHRHAEDGLILEFEPLEPGLVGAEVVAPEPAALVEQITAAMERLGNASNEGALLDAAVQALRNMTGYDRVMAYKFDPDGHGRIVAEARHARLDTLLGHHYPASDIPQRARELYLRTRVRVLVDVHYTPVPVVPRRRPGSSRELDMSLCYLRSMSPLHIQYLKNMGVNATLVISLVREGRLWGLIACHHDSPRNLRYPVRAACDLLAEVISTRLAAIENFAHAQVDILVRRLEQRLIEATSTEGDWRLALFRNPRTLLQPLEATGAALFYDGEILTGGEVPSTPELRALCDWFDARTADSLFATSAVARDNPAFSSLTPTASGVLAIRLSEARPDYLAWFRKEQLLTVTWAGDPSKPVVGDDPLELSPRRSFAAWSEIVRGTALPWSAKELVFARAIGSALIDIIAQVNAVRLLIAEHQIAHVRATIASSSEPVLVVGIGGAASFANATFCALSGRTPQELIDLAGAGLDHLAPLFVEPDAAMRLVRLRDTHEAWRGAVHLARPDGGRVPVSIRAEMVPGNDGRTLGFMVILIDRTENRRTEVALQQLEQSLSRAAVGLSIARPGAGREHGNDKVVGALLANANIAALDISETASRGAVAPVLEEIESSVHRAAALYSRICDYGQPPA